MEQIVYKDASLEKYLDDLAAKLPAPGGGSASALTAALGASLLSMAINFTLGKPKYAEYEQELSQILQQTEKLRREFLRLVDLDITAYQSKNLRDCFNVPFMVCRLCFEAVKFCPDIARKANDKLISDVAVAIALLESAFTSAYCNVDVNLEYLQDKILAKTTRKELDTKLKTIRRLRRTLEVHIGKIIRR